MFEATAFTRRKQWAETAAKSIFLAMTLLMVLPLILIVGYLVYQAWPILSFDFLFTNPRNGMRAGGMFFDAGCFEPINIGKFVKSNLGRGAVALCVGIRCGAISSDMRLSG